MRNRTIEFRVFDLHNEIVLYGDDMPGISSPPYNLTEAIRRFSGQTYALSQYIEQLDMNGKKVYEGDFVKILEPIFLQNFKTRYTDKDIGIVEYSMGIPSILFIKENEPTLLYFSDDNFEFEVIGNYLEDKNLRELSGIRNW